MTTDNKVAKIAIDIDGVTIASLKSWLSQFHPKYIVEDIKDWGVWNWIDDCTKEQFFAEFDILDPRTTYLIDDAYSTICKIAQFTEIFFLTRKTEKQLEWTNKVLNREGLGGISLISVWDQPKTIHKFDYIIDDSPIIAEELGDKVILFDQPWNRHINNNNRVYGWKGVIEKLDKLIHFW